MVIGNGNILDVLKLNKKYKYNDEFNGFGIEYWLLVIKYFIFKSICQLITTLWVSLGGVVNIGITEINTVFHIQNPSSKLCNYFKE